MMPMHLQPASQLHSMSVFVKNAARSWKPALMLLGSKYHLRDFERSLAKSGIVEGITSEFTTIARHLMNLQQDPLSRVAGREINDWTLQLGQHEGGLGGSHSNFMDLQTALEAARY